VRRRHERAGLATASQPRRAAVAGTPPRWLRCAKSLVVLLEPLPSGFGARIRRVRSQGAAHARGKPGAHAGPERAACQPLARPSVTNGAPAICEALFVTPGVTSRRRLATGLRV